MPRLTLRKLSGFDNWYVIERAEHERLMAWIPDREESFIRKYFTSARISDADVEGTAQEMRGIASAIEARRNFTARRCEVRVFEDQGIAVFCSPRNSRVDGVVTLEQADELAAIIRRELG